MDTTKNAEGANCERGSLVYKGISRPKILCALSTARGGDVSRHAKGGVYGAVSMQGANYKEAMAQCYRDRNPRRCVPAL